MTNDKREQLIRFCISADAILNGVSEDLINKSVYVSMTDKDLQREADWLDEMLDKQTKEGD